MRAHLFFLTGYVYWTHLGISGDLGDFPLRFGSISEPPPELTTFRIVIFSMSDIDLPR